MTTKRKNLKSAILGAASGLAHRRGLYKFSRIDVAEEVGIGEGTVSYHFGTMAALRVAIVKRAVEHKIMSVLADACANRKSLGVVISADLRREVAAYVAHR